MPEPHVFASIEEFRRAGQGDEKPESGDRVRAAFIAQVDVADDERRRMMFTISTEDVDRFGDTIAADGWQLEGYRKNPVVLWAHDSTALPVAKALRIWIESNKLKAETEFTPPGLTRFNDTIYDMLKSGFLNAVSVGFLPLKWAYTEDAGRRFGVDFLEQELLEFSIVPVPANPNALVDARSAGVDIEPILEWAEQILLKAAGEDRARRIAQSIASKQGLALFSRERVERIERAAKQHRFAQKHKRNLDVIRSRGF